MKQTQFLVEVIVNEKKNPTIIIRDSRGLVVKLTNDAKHVAAFLGEVVSNIQTPNSVSHE